MMAFIFKPSNESAGRFTLKNSSEIHEAFDRYSKSNPVQQGYYIECSGKTWTVIEKAGAFVLYEGRHSPEPSFVEAEDPDEGPIARGPIYKCIPAPKEVQFSGKADSAKAVKLFADLMNAQSKEGWRFYSMESVAVTELPAGCLGALFGAQPKTEYLYMLVFMKDPE